MPEQHDDQVKRGRPRIEDERALRSIVSVSVPLHVHDRLIRLAERRGTSVSALARDMITCRLGVMAQTTA